MIVLGIETSCDETAVAVVGDRPGPVIRANLIHSQLEEHAPYGGVVPEIAARAHLDHIAGLIGRALAEAGTSVDRLDGIAAAAGPEGCSGSAAARCRRYAGCRRAGPPRGAAGWGCAKTAITG
jgi:N6-L-threonylcarbamoyladenine synthase